MGNIFFTNSQYELNVREHILFLLSQFFNIQFIDDVHNEIASVHLNEKKK